MTESQGNNHWILSEVWRRIKRTFTEYSEKTEQALRKKQADKATVERALSENVRSYERKTTTKKLVIESCAKDTLGLDTKDHVD